MLTRAESNQDRRASTIDRRSPMTRSPVLAVLLIALPALLLSSSLAAASAPGDIRVNIADVDTSTWAGARETFRRVRVAATQLCGVSDHATVTRSDDECIEQIVARAVYRARLPRLTGIYVNQTGRLPRGP